MLINRMLGVVFALACFMTIAPMSEAAQKGSAVIPARLALRLASPLKVKTATLELPNQDPKIVADTITSIFGKLLEKSLKAEGKFISVISISDDALPTGASVAEITQAGREVEADMVLDGNVIEFTGKIEYGFSTLLKEHMVIELVLYETTTNRRLWHRKETVDISKAVSASSWSNERLAKKYISIAEEETCPTAISALLGKLGVELADYKPPVIEKLAAAAAADFVSDVDRVPRSAKEVKKNAYAVVIGIENYRDLQAAEFTMRDARTMKEYLIRVMGFPQENVITLLNDRATRGDIEGYVGTWLKKSAGRDSQVVVYFAGHGAPNPVTGEPYLIPYDGNPAFLEASAVPLKRLYQMLSELDVKDILLIMDSCFSGGGGRSVMAKGGRPIAVSVENPMLASKNIVVLSASKGTEISSSYPEKRHGLFTYFLLKGLQGEADITGDKTINIEKLYNYITPQVKKIARESNREQTPTITPDLDMLGGRARAALATLH